jgi:hypothetical protein
VVALGNITRRPWVNALVAEERDLRLAVDRRLSREGVIRGAIGVGEIDHAVVIYKPTAGKTGAMWTANIQTSIFNLLMQGWREMCVYGRSSVGHLVKMKLSTNKRNPHFINIYPYSSCFFSFIKIC